mmetsp:Transcript_51927/g.151275  ORF Transcript_51927/g.151275 Transcript_51927/m.151275 type:complete len:351 (+) Transcript_51927:1296-2348(+)
MVTEGLRCHEVGSAQVAIAKGKTLLRPTVRHLAGKAEIDDPQAAIVHGRAITFHYKIVQLDVVVENPFVNHKGEAMQQLGDQLLDDVACHLDARPQQLTNCLITSLHEDERGNTAPGVRSPLEVVIDALPGEHCDKRRSSEGPQGQQLVDQQQFVGLLLLRRRHHVGCPVPRADLDGGADLQCHIHREPVTEQLCPEHRAECAGAKEIQWCQVLHPTLRDERAAEQADGALLCWGRRGLPHLRGAGGGCKGGQRRRRRRWPNSRRRRDDRLCGLCGNLGQWLRGRIQLGEVFPLRCMRVKLGVPGSARPPRLQIIFLRFLPHVRQARCLRRLGNRNLRCRYQDFGFTCGR